MPQSGVPKRSSIGTPWEVLAAKARGLVSVPTATIELAPKRQIPNESELIRATRPTRASCPSILSVWVRAGADLYADASCGSADSHRDGGRRWDHRHRFARADLDGGAIANADRYGNSNTFRNAILSAHTDIGAIADRHGDVYAGPHQHGNAHSHANGAAANPDFGGCVPTPIGTAVGISGAILGWAGRVGAGSI
jgi:hypothetical protein